MSTKYRPDIDGLRGLAVVAVVLYHAFPETVRGGFVGVDIFFVISGFLITAIVTDALAAGTFMFREFYARRVRRIFPALMIVLGASWLAGMILLPPDALHSLGEHLMAGAGLSSNVIFWKQAGYFDLASEAKPLLHLWSLGVEEQFYLVWPLLLVASWSWFRGWMWLIAIVTIGSLALALIETPTRHAAAAFYLPTTRAWEFMIGAALAVQRVRLPAVSGWLGLALVGASIVLLDRTMPYPGWRAIAPTVGTALMIAAGPDRLCNRLLGWRPLVGVGLISYPLYLWHWPLLAFCRIANDFEVGVAVRASAIAISVGLAWITYRSVELRLRRGGNRATCALLAVGGAVILLGAIAFTRDTEDARTKAFTAAEAQLLAKHPVHPCAADRRIIGKAGELCEQYGDGGPAIVIWGDSHATAWTPVLVDIAVEEGAATIYIFKHPGCPPMLHVRRTDGIGNAGFCPTPSYADDILHSIQALRPKLVVLVARWSLYANGLHTGGHLAAATHFVTASADGAANEATSRAALAEQLPRTVAELAAIARVVVFEEPPALRTLTRGPIVRSSPGLTPTLEAHRATNAVTDAIIGKLSAKVFDPSAFLCTTKCAAFLNGVPLYIDDSHVSAQGSFELRDKIAPFLRF